MSSKDTDQSSAPNLGPTECLDGNLEFQETSFKDLALYDDLQEDEVDDWSWQQTVLMSPPDSLSSKTQHGPDLASDLEEGLRLLRINCEELQEENLLKNQTRKLQELNDTQNEKYVPLIQGSPTFRTHEQHSEGCCPYGTVQVSLAFRVRQPERKLEEKILEEQKEAQDLESMVQQVEKNLQMITKRVLKVESNVTKSKQEMALLQIELTTYKAENESMRRGEMAGMNAVKQNTNLALENLQKVVSGAQSSIKQLVSGAESLTLVADLLRSIDKISVVHNGDVP
ncbi:hypothetical protein XELAEV_18041531mg [Xenopus laevis]|uniref:Endosome-associated-trafficking regulator 1 n=1 Tax=Xenopus laevis TaxID=8355 RepID=A0A974C2J7_XENLA|nr:hypothetical protein XELAEV_18041531mg [Xenopus laevis]